MKKLLSLPSKSVVRLDERNPWVMVSNQGFEWEQIVVSNVCTAVVSALAVASFLL